MKAKVFGLVAALAVLGTTSVFAFGIGLQVNGNAEDAFATAGPAITFKLDSIPLVFAVNYSLGDVTTVGLTGDYWGVNKKLVSIGSTPLNWFFGVGFFVNFINAEEFAVTGGLRFPLGLNMFLLDGFLEPFVQIAPSMGLQFIPSFGVDPMFFPVSAGLRFWIN